MGGTHTGTTQQEREVGGKEKHLKRRVNSRDSSNAFCPFCIASMAFAMTVFCEGKGVNPSGNSTLRPDSHISKG
jgi:hypothetical protein